MILLIFNQRLRFARKFIKYASFPFDFHFYHIIDAFWTIIKPGAPAPARAWFLKIDPVRIVGMRACMFVCG